MRDRKRRITQFAFYDKAGIQAYLEKQAEKGWMLEKMSFGWVFRRIEPKKLHFFVAYYPEKSIFEAEGSEAQRLFWDFCDHAGWKLAVTNEQMQIFYHEGEDPVPVETDVSLEVEKIHRSARKSYLFTYFLLLATFAMQVVSFVRQLGHDPIGVLSDAQLLLMAPGMGLLGIYVIREILRYFLWYRRAKKMAKEGIFAPAKGIGRFWNMLPFFAGGFILLSIACLDNGMTMRVFLGFLAAMAGLTVLIVCVSRWMRKRRVPAALNRITVIAMTAGGCILLSIGLFVGILKGGMEFGEEPVEIYEYHGWEYRVYRDELPLTLEDLSGEEPWHYADYCSYELTEKKSVFLTKTMGAQDSLPGMEELPWLRYSVTQIKGQALYDWCRERLLKNYEHEQEDLGGIVCHRLRETDKKPWGAEAAYRLYIGDAAENTYVLCFGERIVEINAGFEFTEEQMAIAGERLGR